METQRHHFLDQGGKRVTFPKRRRVSSYKKKGRQGRRTKLTGELLRVISEIVAEVEILSISHLNQELMAMGYSLSRSTVFRAMETLGLRMDRNRKIWCAGPVGKGADQQETAYNFSGGGSAKLEQSQSLIDADTTLYFDPEDSEALNSPSAHHHLIWNDPDDAEGMTNTSGQPEGSHILCSGNVQQAKELPTSNYDNFQQHQISYQVTQRGDSSMDHGSRQTTPSRRVQSHRRADQTGDINITSQTEIVDLSHVKSDSDSTPTPGTGSANPTGSRAVQPLTDALNDGSVNGETRVASSWSEEKKGCRKRKSDCPAKLASSHVTESGGKKYRLLPSAPAPTSAQGLELARQMERKLKGSSSGPGVTESTDLSNKIVSRSVDHPWLTANSSADKFKGATPLPRVEDRGNRDHQTLHDLYLEDEQSDVMEESNMRPVDVRGRDQDKPRLMAAQSAPTKPTLRKSSSQESLMLESETLENGTKVFGEIDSQKSSKDHQITMNRCRTYRESEISQQLHRSDRLKITDVNAAQSATSNNRPTFLQSSKTLRQTDQDNLIPKFAWQRKRRWELMPLRLSKIQDSQAPSVDAGQSHEVDRTTGVKQKLESSGLGSSNGFTNRQNTDKLKFQNFSEHCQPEKQQQASKSLSDDAQLSTKNFNARPTQILLGQKRRGRAGFQTARLHALTSSLVGKTSTMSWATETSLGPRCEVARSSTNGDSRGRNFPGSEPIHPYSRQSTTSDQNLDTPASRGSSADGNFQNGLGLAQETQARSGGQQGTAKASPRTASGEGFRHPPRQSGGYEHLNHKAHNEDTTSASSSGTQCCSIHLQELRSWMQEVSQKLSSMERQLQHLTQVVSNSSGNNVDNERQRASPDEPHAACDDPREDDGGSEADGTEGEDGEEEGQSEMQAWGRRLPPVNTPDSNDLINELISEGRWDTLSPFVGGPRLAIRLARDCIFGPEVLSRSTVTGRNGMNPLQRDGIKRIKECLLLQYGTKCSEVEFEMLWKMTRESLSQLCKRTRRQYAAQVNGQETEYQDDMP